MTGGAGKSVPATGKILDASGIHSWDVRAHSGPTRRCRANVIHVANGVNVIILSPKLDSTFIVMVGGVKVVVHIIGTPCPLHSIQFSILSIVSFLFLFYNCILG
jgi:hypothetical protein